ncbi:MAG: hypothetical protein R3Y36_07445, partial [Spirochaetales bacterium]
MCHDTDIPHIFQSHICSITKKSGKSNMPCNSGIFKHDFFWAFVVLLASMLKVLIEFCGIEVKGLAQNRLALVRHRVA